MFAILFYSDESFLMKKQQLDGVVIPASDVQSYFRGLMFLHLTVNLDSIQGLFICIAFAWIKLTYQDEILQLGTIQVYTIITVD